MKIIQFTDEFKKWLKENNVSLKHAERNILEKANYYLTPVINGKNKIPITYHIGLQSVVFYFNHINNVTIQYMLKISKRHGLYSKAYLINFKPQLIKIFGEENAEIVEKEIAVQFIPKFNDNMSWVKIPKSLKWFRKLLMVS